MQIKTTIKAGQCVGTWRNGWVERVEGNGFYAAVIGDDGKRRFVNYAYTTFIPNETPLFAGELVRFAIYPSGYDNAGKISCIGPLAIE